MHHKFITRLLYKFDGINSFIILVIYEKQNDNKLIYSILSLLLLRLYFISTTLKNRV